MSEAETVTEPPAEAPKKKRRKDRDGWSLLEKTLGLVTALLTMLTAGFGIWGARAASERDELKDTTSSLEGDTEDLQTERADLAEQLETANAQIEDLEGQLEEASTEPSASDDDSGNPTPGQAGQRAQLLTELEAVAGEGQWEVEEGIYVNEGRHDQSLVSDGVGHCGLPIDRTIEYSLRAQYESLSTAVGVTERSDAGRQVRVDIIGDDRELWTGTLQIGQKQDIDVNVSGVIRLKIVVTALFEYVPGPCDSVAAALGDPALD